MIDRARETENLELMTPYAVEELLAGETGALATLKLRNTETGEHSELETAGAFIAIGHVPTSHLVEGQIELNEDGYVGVEGRSTRTNRPGVFGAGDLVDHTYRQAITAAASGCQAALDAEWYLRDTPAGGVYPARLVQRGFDQRVVFKALHRTHWAIKSSASTKVPKHGRQHPKAGAALA
jgi:thioredoxin reductase (NADPH)